MAEAENLFAEALGDERVSKINRQAKLKKFAIDPSLKEEIQKYVIFGKSERKSFEPNSAEDLKRLIKEMEETQAYRDRLTGIIIQSNLLIDDLSILVTTGESYLFTEYAHLMKKCGNAETRKAAISYVYSPVIRRKAQWKSLKTSAELARKNLDDTYFAVREIGENARNILDSRKVRRSFDA